MIIQNRFIFNIDSKEMLNKEEVNALVNKIYIDEVIKVDFNQVRCNKCQSIGNYEIKGYYHRTIIVDYYSIRIKVLRVKCKICKRTHAVIFADFIPYYQLRSTEARRIILNNFIEDIYDADIIKRLKNRAIKFSYRLKELFLTLKESIKEINDVIIPNRKISYLQIHKGIVIRNLSS